LQFAGLYDMSNLKKQTHGKGFYVGVTWPEDNVKESKVSLVMGVALNNGFHILNINK
jgi:hypothetical protein